MDIFGAPANVTEAEDIDAVLGDLAREQAKKAAAVERVTREAKEQLELDQVVRIWNQKDNGVTDRDGFTTFDMNLFEDVFAKGFDRTFDKATKSNTLDYWFPRS